MSNPWMKFYPTDWRADPGLRISSLPARGLWIECLCIMHEAEPYGHLVLNGNPVTEAQLAVLTGSIESTVRELLSELETNAVFSRNRHGVIYSRRMTNDYKKSKVGEKSVKKRWKSENSDTSQDADIKKKKSAPNRSPNRLPITKKPEARSQNKEKPPKENHWWAGEVIKLNRRDYEAWLERFPGNDDQFTEWLIGRDRWYQDQNPSIRKNWFFATSEAIGKLSSEAA